MMNTDCFFTSAQRPKKNCQDYALCNYEPIPYVILCDGCSSSMNTDIGSRLLAFSVRRNIKDLLIPALESSGTDMEELYRLLGIRSIHHAWRAASSVDLSLECLDSTLIVAFYWNKKTYCFVYGDGTIVSTEPFWVTSRKVSFEGNAPFYLSYYLDKGRLTMYEKFAEEWDGFTKRVIITDLLISNTLKFDSPVIFEMDKKDLVLVSTDGINSFIDFNTVERVPSDKIVNEFVSLKNTKGEFIKRRVRRALEDFNKENIFLADDLSVGAILMED